MRPWQVEVRVPDKPGIQSVFDIGVDIYSAIPDSAAGHSYIIRGAAFGNQVAEMNKRNYAVTVISKD